MGWRSSLAVRLLICQMSTERTITRFFPADLALEERHRHASIDDHVIVARDGRGHPTLIVTANLSPLILTVNIFGYRGAEPLGDRRRIGEIGLGITTRILLRPIAP